jgi:hypothetical protein
MAAYDSDSLDDIEDNAAIPLSAGERMGALKAARLLFENLCAQRHPGFSTVGQLVDEMYKRLDLSGFSESALTHELRSLNSMTDEELAASDHAVNRVVNQNHAIMLGRELADDISRLTDPKRNHGIQDIGQHTDNIIHGMLFADCLAPTDNLEEKENRSRAVLAVMQLGGELLYKRAAAKAHKIIDNKNFSAKPQAKREMGIARVVEAQDRAARYWKKTQRMRNICEFMAMPR